MTPATALRTDTLLSIENVSLSYGENVVLRDVNVKIRDLVRPDSITGQVVGLLAPSGRGKTTLLRIIAGLLKSDTGTVLIGKDRAPVRPGDVGLVSQNSVLHRHRDILSSLCLAARHLPDPKQAAVDILNDFGLLDKAHLYPIQLSGGQRQRISISEQILSAGNFLLMDEPTAALDPIAKAEVCRLITQVADCDELQTLIISSHDIPSLLTCCDTLWIMGREPGKPGSTIIDTIDLIDRGIYCSSHMHKTPEFAAMVEELQERFSTL